MAMATHGRSDAARLIIGSVTEEVLRRSSGPFLVIRTMEEKLMKPDA